MVDLVEVLLRRVGDLMVVDCVSLGLCDRPDFAGFDLLLESAVFIINWDSLHKFY